jgi:transposase
MDLLGKIRRWHYRDSISIREIAAKTSLSRNTVRKYLRDRQSTPDYPERRTVGTKLDAFLDQLNAWLAEDERLPRKQRRSTVKLHAALQALGYAGSYGRVAAYVRDRGRQGGAPSSAVFIPLRFAPGEAFQFDFSTETVELGGQLHSIKVAHIRLCYSRKFLVVAYPRETQEMVFDAHWRAFQHFGGVPRRGIYDNMSTAVDRVLPGKERDYNRRFEHMTAHYLFEPQACNVASGWEKGQVERQVALVRQWLFVPRARFGSLALLNAWLAERCQAIAQQHPHPDQPGRTIEDVFQSDEQPLLGPLPTMFDGFQERICRVSPSSLVLFERNRYSVQCAWVNQPVAVRAYADHIKVVADGEVVAEHPRQFQRNVTLYNPWHYLPALERKPGALRNGAPFIDWDLPAPIARLQSRITKLPGGDRQFVTILAAIPVEGLDAVTVACELALEANVVTSDYVLNALSRFKPQPRVTPVALPQDLQLKTEPEANTLRYDSLLKGPTVKSTVIVMAAAMLAAQAMLEVSHGTA